MKRISKLDKTAPGQPAAICWSPNGNQLAVNHPKARVSIYSLLSSQIGINTTPDVILETGAVTQIRWNTDSTLTLIDASNKSKGLNISAWDILNRRQISAQQIPLTTFSAWNAAFTVGIRAEGNQLFLGDNVVEVSRPLITHLQLSANGQTAVVIVDDPQPKRQPFTLSRDKVVPHNIEAVEVWDVGTGNRLCLHRPGIRALTELSISPNGQFYTLRGYYQGSEGIGDIRQDFSIYECTADKERFRDWRFFEDAPILPTWATDSQQVIYWTWNKTLVTSAKPCIGIFDVATRREQIIRHVGLGRIAPTALAWSSDRALLAVGDVSGIVHVYAL